MTCKNLDVFNIKKQFLCCTPLSQFNFRVFKENRYSFNIDVQKDIVNNTVDLGIVKQYPLKKSYQLAFLKLLINKIEENQEEVLDSLYETYCNLVSLTDKDLMHYRHFVIGDNKDCQYISVQESINIISNGTTGLCSWQATFGLIEWCNQNKDRLYGKTILELGSGIGLAGLTIINICEVKKYIFSDYHPTVLNMLCKNIELNLPSKENFEKEGQDNERFKLESKYKSTAIEVLDLNWEEIGEFKQENFAVPDIIIAADILYETDCFDILRKGLQSLLSHNNNYAIIAATVRNEITFSQFIEYLGDYNLEFEVYDTTKSDIIVQTIDIPIKILKIYYKKHK